jgi:hypothetical protein
MCKGKGEVHLKPLINGAISGHRTCNFYGIEAQKKYYHLARLGEVA